MNEKEEDNQDRSDNALLKKTTEDSTQNQYEKFHSENASNKRGEALNIKKTRKKRRTFSCELCRKFKTRCDFEPLTGKCHRCNVLQLDCSLTEERECEIIAAVRDKSGSIGLRDGSSDTNEALHASDHSQLVISSIRLTEQLERRLSKVESHFESLDNKLDLVLGLLREPSDGSVKTMTKLDPHLPGFDDFSKGMSPLTASKYGSQFRRASHSLTDRVLKDPPLKLIGNIDNRLFPREARSKQDQYAKQQRPFVVARVNFLHFYEKHEELCLKLSKEFLIRSHFWIVPGGIKEIDDDYVRKHVFITSVFTIIAMSFDDNEKYASEQEMLYPLVERFLTNTLTMFENLIAHDIEAILYCCMFHISRKAKRHRQLQFNSLVLSDFALNSFLSIFNFNKLKKRVVVEEIYDPTDLYYLRILNSLTACKLEYAVSYGCYSTLDDSTKELNNLTAKFPQSNFGDDIKISEINLGDIVNSIFVNFEEFYETARDRLHDTLEISDATQNSDLLAFSELTYWVTNWKELLSKDGAGVLLFTFDYYYIMICRSFISEFLSDIRTNPAFMARTLNTMKEHAFSLIKGFLRLPPSLIKGAPILTSHQLVYACLALCDFLDWFPSSERQSVLNICTRVYWHLNTIGEKKNEATDNVGKIIKSIIDTSRYRVSKGQQISSLPSTGPTRERTSSNKINFTTDPPKADPQVSVHSRNSPSETTSTAGNFMMPDVDQFNSFEEFFQDFFENLKPTTQQIFSSQKNLVP
ncbi:hypothetical protein HG536_0B00430 [Torulaspora globosa]|uniref:Zn(2)-C6 fungal-type domain-containing protein n=1 Tax=Torulaspora globosa TaxID=48254 RepID=A0A7G3ZCE6_9SACH|nr:uncharacterized protein HG536_0B00430 [Torulaspora globosa]QLL31182.1 hypothetical protein HG536_0B00430 [Torulaspora globosa]